MTTPCCYYVHKTIMPCKACTSTRSISCDCSNQENLKKLKDTNVELKSLIRKLDNLCDTVDSATTVTTREVTITECDCPCGLCKDSRNDAAIYTMKCDYVLCDKCHKMLKQSELERKHSRDYGRRELVTLDSKVYPLERYSSGRKYYCSQCDLCEYERHRSRSRTRSRSRSQSRSRSRSRVLYSRSPSSSSRSTTPEQRPVWNGGPYTSYYTWRNWKLNEKK